MTENTNEKKVEEKRSRYSAVSIILRQMYGTKNGRDARVYIASGCSV